MIWFLGPPDPVRHHWPARALAEAGYPVRCVSTLTTEDRPGDTVLVRFPRHPTKGRMMTSLRRRGYVPWLHEDDDVSSLPNSHLALDDNAEEWRRMWPPAHRLAVETAEHVLVSTPHLAHRYPEGKARVARNFLPRWVGDVRSPVLLGTVGYMGHHRSHVSDLDWFAPAVRFLRTNYRLATVGDDTIHARWEWEGPSFGWVRSHVDLYRIMASFDVGIVPLAPTAFNRSKSWLKALELCSLGVPTVAAFTLENRALAELVPNLVLGKSPAEMANAVRELMGWKPKDRRAWGEALRESCRALTIEANVSEWAVALGLEVEGADRAQDPRVSTVRS